MRSYTEGFFAGKGPLPPSEAVRAVRATLRNKENEIQQLARRLKLAETQAKEFMSKFEAADEARRRVERQLFDAKREINVQWAVYNSFHSL